MQLCTTTSPPPAKSKTTYYLNSNMRYLQRIAELIKVSTLIKHTTAKTYPWKLHIPTKPHLYYILQKQPRKTPTGIRNATSSALSSGKRDRQKHKFTGIHFQWKTSD